MIRKTLSVLVPAGMVSNAPGPLLNGVSEFDG